MNKAIFRNRFVLGLAVLLSAGALVNARTIGGGEHGQQGPSATQSIKVFPNPFNNVLNVSLRSPVGRPVIVRIVSQNGGATVMHQTFPGTGGVFQLNTASVPAGRYAVTVSTDEGTLLGTSSATCAH